ncbi:MAG: glycosyltransferase [Bacteroidetes bacterium]|nr:glycosyltransferase [Bacteroidota bacterium]
MPHQRKVVLIGSAYPLRGGLAAFNERLAREYLNRGDDVTIYTFTLQYPGILFPGKTQYSSDPPPKDLDIKVKINSINPFNWWKTGKELKKLKPDLVIVKFWMPFMSPCFGTICRIIRNNKRTKVVSILDNLIPHEKHPGDKLLIKYFVKSMDGFVAMSHSVENDLMHFSDRYKLQKPVLFSPHPLYDNFGDPIAKNVAKQHLNLDPDVNYILFFGFIRDYKGLDLLLKAFADERLRNYPVKLLVAGEFYTDTKPYLDIIEKEGLKDRVIMSNDFIPDGEVANYFSACDLVVQPYKNATQSGVSQIAYHFNKPMILTDVGGLSETVPHGKVGYVVKPDETEIASAILNFYENRMEEAFSQNAAIEKLRYSWGKMVEAIDKLAK